MATTGNNLSDDEVGQVGQSQERQGLDFEAAIDPISEELENAKRVFSEALAVCNDDLSVLQSADFKAAVGVLSADEVRRIEYRIKFMKGTPKGFTVGYFDSLKVEKKPVNSVSGDLARPCYVAYETSSQYGKAGVYYHSVRVDREGNATEVDDYICDWLVVDAGSCDRADNSFGLLLRFKNSRGRERQWLMPMSMLSGSCEELRAQLLDLGLAINHLKRNHLANYLMQQQPDRKLECALQVGWHDDCFVLPDRVMGCRDDVFFQSDHAVAAEYSQRGTLEDWQTHISRLCMGNRLLTFQASTAFAGALLKKVFMDFAGFHIVGDSSTGKTTGQEVAVSVCGSEDYSRTWKATSNGLEAAAVLFNDGLLALDELGNSDGREVNQIIYMLGNGTGKQRANVKGTARKNHRWRLVLLSNGEKTLEGHLSESGLKVMAGHLVRFLQIPIFGQYGAFDDLHGMASGRLFADTLKKHCKLYYGTAYVVYLEKLVADTQDFGALLELALRNFVTEDLQPQEQRAARQFALVALAGELATEYGITGWNVGDAARSALACFEQWRNQRGKGTTEDFAILRAVRDFVDRYGDTRFTRVEAKEGRISGARAGWFSGEKVLTYHFTRAGLGDATTGYDFKRVTQALISAGWLKPEGNTRQLWADGKNNRVYDVLVGEVV